MSVSTLGLFSGQNMLILQQELMQIDSCFRDKILIIYFCTHAQKQLHSDVPTQKHMSSRLAPHCCVFMYKEALRAVVLYYLCYR